MMGMQAGIEVLYVGDHIYGDVLRSKKVRFVVNLYVLSYRLGCALAVRCCMAETTSMVTF
jgi:hypothetical protein